MNRSKVIRFWLTLSLCMLTLWLSASHPANASSKYVPIAELLKMQEINWHQTYEAQGRSIVINIDHIVLPDVERLPVFTVTGADAAHNLPVPSNLVTINAWNNLLFRTGENPDNNFAVGTKMQPRMDRVYLAQDVESIDWDYHADGNPVSIRQAVDRVRNEISTYYGSEVAESLAISRIAMTTKTLHYNGKTREYGEPVNHPDNMGQYSVEMYQTFYGIPVLAAGGGSFEYMKGDQQNLSCYVIGYIYNEQIYALNANIVREVKMQSEDIPLLPFSEIKLTLEKLIQEGRIRVY